VGLGDVDRRAEVPAVTSAVERAGAGDVVAKLAAGVDTQLGATWPGGVELSFGQWQKLALARLHARPAGSSRSSRGAAAGRIMILVSHRFSTVRMADLIVVLDGAKLVELGSHDELIARGGAYAELYGIQAAAYR
jgi:ATP-binding cassette subfamily B protein